MSIGAVDPAGPHWLGRLHDGEPSRRREMGAAQSKLLHPKGDVPTCQKIYRHVIVQRREWRQVPVDIARAFLRHFFLLVLVVTGASSFAANPPSLALLDVHFQNDNESLEPTSDAERARIARTGEEFAQQLSASGKFKTMPTTEAVRAKIASGQAVGGCGGCEVDYGRALGTDFVAWIRVQKVSNLILNMNVYIADVKSGRLVLRKSVDLRGNTDDSWMRSLRYLIKNSVLTAVIKQPG